MTAMSALDTAAVTQVKHLMGGRDAADIAAWAHKVNKKYPFTEQLHFQRQPSDRCERADLSDCKDNWCLVKAIRHFYGRLTGKNLVDLSWPNGIKLTDADCLKYLINLIGDMHQPIHFATASTDAGRNFTVEFRGQRMSLYDVWDKEMTQSIIRDQPGFWWGGWTNVQRSRVEYDRDKEQFKQEHEALLGKWADENAKFLCEKVWRNPLSGRQITEEVQDGVFRIPDQLYEVWKQEMMSKILVAGARTAIILNSILHHREGAELHGGSAVGHIDDDEDQEEEKGAPRRGRKAEVPRVGRNHVQGVTALVANAAIGSVAIVTFLVLMRIWSSPAAAVTRANVEKQRGDSGKKT